MTENYICVSITREQRDMILRALRIVLDAEKKTASLNLTAEDSLQSELSIQKHEALIRFLE